MPSQSAFGSVKCLSIGIGENKMLMETYKGTFVEVSLQQIQQMSRQELVEYLELRGTACFDDESTELLRECAIEDWEGELQ